MAGIRPRDLLFPFLAAHAIFPAMWLLALSAFGPLTNDWLQLKLVADHFVAGDWASLYAVGEDAINPGYYWRYPPFGLYLVAPLAWLPRTGAYATLVVIEMAALVQSLVLLHRLAPFREMRVEWVLAICLSAPALTTVTTGQSSALILLCLVGGTAAWAQGHRTKGAALLGLLAIKPNWGIVFGVWALVRGEWRAAATMVAVVVGLCAITLPLGLQLWQDFLSTSVPHAFALGNVEPRRLITIRAFLEAVFGRSPPVIWTWMLVSLCLVGAAITAWRVQGSALRHVGIGVLLVVAANPYAFFYDALVLALPATAWWAERDQWPRRLWLGAGVCIATAWVGEQYLYSWDLLAVTAQIPRWQPRYSLVGPATGLWLVLAALQTRTARVVPADQRISY